MECPAQSSTTLSDCMVMQEEKLEWLETSVKVPGEVMVGQMEEEVIFTEAFALNTVFPFSRREDLQLQISPV